MKGPVLLKGILSAHIEILKDEHKNGKIGRLKHIKLDQISKGHYAYIRNKKPQTTKAVLLIQLCFSTLIYMSTTIRTYKVYITGLLIQFLFSWFGKHQFQVIGRIVISTP